MRYLLGIDIFFYDMQIEILLYKSGSVARSVWHSWVAGSCVDEVEEEAIG